MRESKKIDRRVIYTKRAIRDSFIELQQQKPIEKISVTEICKSADINRGTFYSHYSDPYDLRKSLEQELVDTIESRIREMGVEKLEYAQVFQLFRENKELCKIFAGPYADKAALLDIVLKQTDKYIDTHKEYIVNATETQVSYLRALLASSIAISIHKWFNNGLDSDPAEIADILERFCFHGISGFEDNAEASGNDSVTE